MNKWKMCGEHEAKFGEPKQQSCAHGKKPRDNSNKSAAVSFIRFNLWRQLLPDYPHEIHDIATSPDWSSFIGDATTNPDCLKIEQIGSATSRNQGRRQNPDRVKKVWREKKVCFHHKSGTSAGSLVSGHKHQVPQAVEAPHAVLAVRAPPNGKWFQLLFALTNCYSFQYYI